MKTFRGTGLFALFVVGLALASYLIVYQGEQKKNQAKETASILIPFAAADVTEVIVEGKNALHLLKQDGGWKLLKPIEYGADTSEVENFVQALLSEKSIDVVREDGDIPWNVFGLDQPSGSVTVRNVQGEAKKLILSNRKTYNNDLYLRSENENKVLLVSSTWSSYLAKDAKSLRDKSVFKGDPAKVNEIRINAFKRGSQRTVQLVRSADKKIWQFKGTPNLNVDEQEVKNFLDQLKDIRALDFAVEDQSQLSKYEITSPRATKVELVYEGGKSSDPDWVMSVSPANKEGHAFLVATGLKPIIQVYKTAADRLRLEPDDFRNKSEPFQFKSSQVQKITYRSPLFSTDLIKEQGVWKLKDPKEGQEVAKDQVENLLKSLSGLKVERFVGAGKGKGLNPPKNLVALRDGEDKLLISVRWGEEFKDEGPVTSLVYVNTSLSSDVFGVDAAKIKELPGQTLIKAKEDKQKPQPAQAAPPAPAAPAAPKE